MGSKFPPESLNIIDTGDAPVFFIDGVAAYGVSRGVVRLALYAEQPVIEPGSMPGDRCTHMRIVVAKLVYTMETQVVMRRQMVNEPGDSVRPSDLAEISLS